MRKSVKIITILAIALSIILSATIVFAGEGVSPVDPSSFTGKEIGGFKDAGETVIGIVQTIGTIIAIVIVVWVGIQYLMASTEQKAEYKKTMIAYLVGAILVFIGPRVVGVIYNMATKLDLGSGV